MKANILAAAVMIALAGCASKQNNGTENKTAAETKTVDKSPDAEAYKPKPVSTVFNRPEGPTVLEFTDDGQLIGITATASAPIAGNNAYSIEQAAQVATIRARRNISEFMANQLNTTRTIKVLSHTVQKSKENTANGTAEDVMVDDRAFDTEGNTQSFALNDGEVISNPQASFSKDNVNAEKIAQTVRENILTSSTALLRGVYTVSEQVDPAGRTVTVVVRASKNSIGAAGDLRRMMENAGK